MASNRPAPPILTRLERAAVLREHARDLDSERLLTAAERTHQITDRVRDLEAELRRSAAERLDAIADLIEAGDIRTPTGMAHYVGGLHSPGSIWRLWRAAQARLAERHSVNGGVATIDEAAVAVALDTQGEKAADIAE